jgi:hypothetical protein
LFDHPVIGAERFRLVPDRRRQLAGFVLDDETWAGLGIPVEMAFAFRDSAARRAVVCYPSPGGVVEAPADLAVWESLEEANPVLRQMEPDVEGLLVNRTGRARDHWLVPIDECYALVALLRTRWKGLAGGADLWAGVAAFFTDLRLRAAPAPADRPKGATR